MLLLLLALQGTPPPPSLPPERGLPGVMRLEGAWAQRYTFQMPSLRLLRPGEAWVEVTAPELPEATSAELQLRRELILEARRTFSLAGSGSLEGRTLLATFASYDASTIQGLANAQTRALQNLFNPPRFEFTRGLLGGAVGVSATAAPGPRR